MIVSFWAECRGILPETISYLLINLLLLAGPTFMWAYSFIKVFMIIWGCIERS
jgi:hypothetical protein